LAQIINFTIAVDNLTLCANRLSDFFAILTIFDVVVFRCSADSVSFCI